MATTQGTLDVLAAISDPGTASLVQAMPPRIQVHDGEFNMVAKGFGTLKREFDPGLYFVRVEVGDKPYEQVVRVPSNGTATVTYPVNTSPRCSSAAVVEGTSSLHEYTSDYTRALSKTKAKLTPGSGARLVVLASRQRPDTAAEIRFNGVRLLDRTGKCIADLSRRSSVEGPTNDNLARGFAAEVNPGGLVLEWKHETMNTYWRQPLWIPQGYVMLVFVTVRPGQTTPDMATASIHLASLSEGFEPRDSHGAAAEAALESLRTGRQLLSETRLAELLQGKFQNPMLGIYGGHMILQSSSLPVSVKIKGLDEVVGNLQSLIPDSPDLAALHLMSSELKDTIAPHQIPCSWPPMIRLGYLAFRNADWDAPGTFIEEGSVADRIRTMLGVAGVWSTWPATDRNNKTEFPAAHSADPMEFVMGQLSDSAKAVFRNVAEDLDPLNHLIIEKHRTVPKLTLSHFAGAGFGEGTADSEASSDLSKINVVVQQTKPNPASFESLAWTGLNKKQAQDVANRLL
jgi:hypothetical protein